MRIVVILNANYRRIHRVCFGGDDRWFALRYAADIRGEYLPGGGTNYASNYASQEILGLLGHPVPSLATRRRKAFWNIRRLKRRLTRVADDRLRGGMMEGAKRRIF